VSFWPIGRASWLRPSPLVLLPPWTLFIRAALLCTSSAVGMTLIRPETGDFSDKPSRYRRTDEFLDVVERESSSVPFSYEGRFYQVADGLSSVRRPSGHLPVYFGGASDDAIRVGGRHADVYAFWGEPLDGIKERIRQVQESAGLAPCIRGRHGTDG
jgi:alkanesulfonate monooxygenase SsuD/methylene tetrahydromethanopterin reductase-like flavin-dependent oxidoreductase (luciferase family)